MVRVNTKKMRVTLTIPKDLMEESMALSDAKTKNQVIEKALQAYINTIKKQKLIALKGTLDFDIDLDNLRERNDFSL